MGSNNFNSVLSKYVKEKYAIVKEDLYSCFLERCFEFCLPNYFVAMVTMESWMFNTTFSKFRSKMLGDRTIINMTHMPYLGKGGTSMGISFGTTAFAYKKCHMPEYKGSYNCVRYYETDENDVPYSFPVINEKYNIISQSSFEKLPDNVISYWIKDNILDTFIKEKLYRRDLEMLDRD